MESEGAFASSLREMNERRQQWLNEKPQWDGNSEELRISTGDLVIFQFMANGDEGDRFIWVYRSHTIPRIGKEGGRYTETRYCPVKSGEPDIACPLCVAGHIEIKERFSAWLYVSDILHSKLPAKMPKGKTFPQVPYQGNIYFREEVKAFKIWHTSAWLESPWTDIWKNAEIYKGLHNFTANLEVTGTGTATRYKLYALPNSAMVTPELYALAQQECRPIREILHSQISSEVQVNPQTQQQPYQPKPLTVTPFTMPGQELPTFEPTFIVGDTSQEPTAEAPTITTIPPPEGEEKRPMKSLF